MQNVHYRFLQWILKLFLMTIGRWLVIYPPDSNNHPLIFFLLVQNPKLPILVKRCQHCQVGDSIHLVGNIDKIEL